MIMGLIILAILVVLVTVIGVVVSKKKSANASSASSAHSPSKCAGVECGAHGDGDGACDEATGACI